MLIAMLEINGNYEELKHIQMFSKCQFGEESEEVNVSLTVKQKELACQRYDLRFSAIVKLNQPIISLFNGFILKDMF